MKNQNRVFQEPYGFGSSQCSPPFAPPALHRALSVERGEVAPPVFRVSCLAAAFAAVLLLQPSAFATTNYWIGGASGDFTNAANWSTAVPTAVDTASFTNNSTVSVAVNTAVTNSDSLINSSSGSLDMNIALGASWMVTNKLRVGTTSGSSSTLSLTNGGSLLLGGSATIYVGGELGGSGRTGVVLLVSGQLGNNAGAIRIGDGGKGTLTQSGGSLAVNTELVGGVGSAARGVFNLSGGTNNATFLYVGRGAGSGTVLINGGSLTVGSGGAFVGDSTAGSVGTLTNAAGGASWFSSTLTIGNAANVTGAVSVTGGSLAVTNSGGTAKLVVGQSGQGTFTLSGGTVTVDQLLVTNGANSSFSASGGSLTIKAATIGSSFSLTNTTATISSNLTVTGSGSLSGTNGAFVLSGNFINQSTNRVRFDLSQSAVLFTNGVAGATNHTFNLTNSGAVDMGASWANVGQLATNFSIGTLSIALSNNLTVTGNKSGATTNALYVGWLDLTVWNTNASALSATLSNALTLTDINLYYDAGDARNAYLNDQTYDLWGGGLLIPVPEPSALMLTLAAGALSMFLLRRKRNEK